METYGDPVANLLFNKKLYRLSPNRESKIVIDTQFEMGFASFFSLRYSQFSWKHVDKTGVSASHLDWTMVPYVRKSFRKHFIDGLKYVDGSNDFNDIPKDASIESAEYKSQPKAYKYAMDMTEREVHQAVESMYHNLKY